MKPTPLKKIASQLCVSPQTNNSILEISSGVSADSRMLHPGDLFFALPGAQTDGHLFIREAALAGASGAVVSRSYQGEDFGLPLLFVDDVLISLQKLAKYFLEEKKRMVVAVTGSLGKTTTKEFLGTLLSKKFKVSISPGNHNSQIGLPLAILNHMSTEDEVIVLEMGMTHSGELKKLVDIAKPDIAIVTQVALVHVANFASLEGIAQAKAEIFSHPSTKIGIYHAESDLDRILSSSGMCKKQSFSTINPQSDFYICEEKAGFTIKQLSEEPVAFSPLPVPGGHNLHNFLAAVAVAKNLGMEWEEIKEAQSSLQLPERRLQYVQKNGVLFVNDAYNASEMSMKSALNSLPIPQVGGKKIAFLGGMVELGKFSEECHRNVGQYALDSVEMMFCFGVDCLPIAEVWQAANRQVYWKETREALVPLLQEVMQQGDVVLLKGSCVKTVWKVLDELRV